MNTTPQHAVFFCWAAFASAVPEPRPENRRQGAWLFFQPSSKPVEMLSARRLRTARSLEGIWRRVVFFKCLNIKVAAASSSAAAAAIAAAVVENILPTVQSQQ